jgi:hypothetical protein
MRYQLSCTNNCVIDTSRDVLIPNDPLNIDWASYQEWLAAGNTPAPAAPAPWTIAPSQQPS